MKMDTFSMDAFSDSLEGRAILQTAALSHAWHIIQRLAPSNSSESKDGAYLVMILDWKNGMVVRLIFDSDEVNNLSEALKSLCGMEVLDAFEVEGATIQ